MRLYSGLESPFDDHARALALAMETPSIYLPFLGGTQRLRNEGELGGIVRFEY